MSHPGTFERTPRCARSRSHTTHRPVSQLPSPYASSAKSVDLQQMARQISDSAPGGGGRQAGSQKSGICHTDPYSSPSLQGTCSMGQAAPMRKAMRKCIGHAVSHRIVLPSKNCILSRLADQSHGAHREERGRRKEKEATKGNTDCAS